MERVGKCKNFGPCGMANSQRQQVITDDEAEFVCAECGTELEKVELCGTDPGGKNRPGRVKIVVAIGVLVLIGLGLVYWLNGGEASETAEERQAIGAADTLREEEVCTEEAGVAAGEGEYEDPTAVTLDSADIKTLNGVGSVALSYGVYKGEVREGRPHGIGTLYYRSARLISKYDEHERRAEPGDYIVGEFSRGELVQGKWFDKAKKQKGVIMIGRAK